MSDVATTMNGSEAWPHRVAAIGKDAVLLLAVVLALPCAILLIVAPLAVAIRLLLRAVGAD